MASPQSDHDDPNPKHTLFCRMVGMPPNLDNSFYSTSRGSSNKAHKDYVGLYPRVKKRFNREELQYRMVATLSNGLHWIQIIFGAALAGLGGTKSSKVSIAIILFGGIQTVIGGLLTYFKSRDQPNRARQARRRFRNVLSAIEDAEGMLRDPNYDPAPYIPIAGSSSMLSTKDQSAKGVEGMVLKLMDMYADAVKEVENNYPDFWLTMSGDNGKSHSDLVNDVVHELRTGGFVHTSTSDSDTKATASNTNTNTK